MNILVVCHYGLYRDFTSSFVHAQAKAYARLGHRVRVLVPIALGKRDWNGSRFSAKSRLVDGVELVPLRHVSLSNYGKAWFNTPSALAALRSRVGSVLAGFSPDVIHAHTLGPDTTLGAWLKARLHVPLVVTTHGSDTFVPFEKGDRAGIKQQADQADIVVCVSTLLKKRLLECGVSAPMPVILNGFNVQYALSNTEKTPLSLIQAGYLVERKKADVTIRALAALRDQHPEASLEIVGSGSEMERFQLLCKELSVTDAVRFHGFLPNSETLAEMAKAHFFVMPSVREGFGIVYLEAMTNQCITIGTEGEGIADLIVSGVNGFLVPPDDPDAIVKVVEWCLAHPEESAAIAERGQRDARGLTWEKNAGEYIRLFQLLTEENREI